MPVLVGLDVRKNRGMDLSSALRLFRVGVFVVTPPFIRPPLATQSIDALPLLLEAPRPRGPEELVRRDQRLGLTLGMLRLRPEIARGYQEPVVADGALRDERVELAERGRGLGRERRLGCSPERPQILRPQVAVEGIHRLLSETGRFQTAGERVARLRDAVGFWHPPHDVRMWGVVGTLRRGPEGRCRWEVVVTLIVVGELVMVTETHGGVLTSCEGWVTRGKTRRPPEIRRWPQAVF